MSFSNWRPLWLILSKLHKAQIDHVLHFLFGGVNPTPFWHLAGLSSCWIPNLVTGTTAAGPRNVAITPRTRFVHVLKPTQRLRRMRVRQVLEPLAQTRLNMGVIVAVLFPENQILIP